MELLEYFNAIDLEEINRFIEEGQEEHLHLEFKQATHPSKESKLWKPIKRTFLSVFRVLLILMVV